MFEERTRTLQARLANAGLAVALITDDDSVYYFSGFYDYLHMEFGRPTILAVPAQGAPVLVTPTIELEMAQGMTWIEDIRPWQDGEGSEWRGDLQQLIETVGSAAIGIERGSMPSLVRDFVDHSVTDSNLTDITSLIAELRMIKSNEELQLARHSGQVAMAMMTAGRDAIREGVPEYEVALATSEAGARSAAELLAANYDDGWMSPNTQFCRSWLRAPISLWHIVALHCVRSPAAIRSFFVFVECPTFTGSSWVSTGRFGWVRSRILARPRFTRWQWPVNGLRWNIYGLECWLKRYMPRMRR